MSKETFNISDLNEDERYVLETYFNIVPKEYVSVLNIPKYKSMLSAITKIKKDIDCCVSQYDETAEYSIRFGDIHSAIMESNVSFGVRIPADIGIDISVSSIKSISEHMSNDDIVSIEPCADGRIDLIFCFKNVQRVI